MQNEEIESIQLYFEQMGVHYNELFGEFTKFQNIHHQQQKILDSLKAKCYNFYRKGKLLNENVVWLHKNMSIPSIDSSYSHALRTIQSGTKLVWNNVTNKATCERNFGKDALLLAINEELKQNCLTGEKANSSDEEKDEEDVVGEKRGNDDTEPSTSKKKKH